MTSLPADLSPDDWLLIRDALRYMGRDLHHRSYAVSAERRHLLWEEMDRCLALADQVASLPSVCSERGEGASGSWAGCRAGEAGDRGIQPLEAFAEPIQMDAPGHDCVE